MEVARPKTGERVATVTWLDVKPDDKTPGVFVAVGRVSFISRFFLNEPDHAALTVALTIPAGVQLVSHVVSIGEYGKVNVDAAFQIESPDALKAFHLPWPLVHAEKHGVGKLACTLHFNVAAISGMIAPCNSPPSFGAELRLALDLIGPVEMRAPPLFTRAKPVVCATLPNAVLRIADAVHLNIGGLLQNGGAEGELALEAVKQLAWGDRARLCGTVAHDPGMLVSAITFPTAHEVCEYASVHYPKQTRAHRSMFRTRVTFATIVPRDDARDQFDLANTLAGFSPMSLRFLEVHTPGHFVLCVDGVAVCRIEVRPHPAGDAPVCFRVDCADFYIPALDGASLLVGDRFNGITLSRRDSFAIVPTDGVARTHVVVRVDGTTVVQSYANPRPEFALAGMVFV